jgi:putative (di)nucleoside polyphosphate hydrolase
MKDCIDADGFRANVGIILTNDAGRVFWAGRAGRPGWQFPQGGILPGESARTAMYRELEEEIGLKQDDVRVLGTTRGWLRYRLPRRYIRQRSQPLCIGQKQRWFLLRLVADDCRVRFDCCAHPEFDRWCWVSWWEPVDEVIYFKRRVYLRALREFGRLVFPEGPPPRPGPDAAQRAE